jgi:AcrR family transcriptional regulator
MAKDNRLKPRKLPVQARSKMTVEVILDAAEQVFAQRGFTGGTTNHIAEQAGVSIGSLYQYFPNKEAIMMGLMERHLAEEQTHLAEHMRGPSDRNIQPRELLRGLISTMVSEQMIDPGFHRVLIEAVLGSPAVMHRGREVLDRVVEELAGLIEEQLDGMAETRVKDVGRAARMATITGFLLTHWFVLSGTEEIDTDRYVDEVTDLLARYLFE